MHQNLIWEYLGWEIQEGYLKSLIWLWEQSGLQAVNGILSLKPFGKQGSDGTERKKNTLC